MSVPASTYAAVLVYFAGLAFIAYFASRRIGDIGDFFVGGKKLGIWVVSFSSLATGESGWLLLGLTGMGFAVGAHAFWVLMGEMAGVVVCWVFLAERFKVLTDRYGSITVPDYLESRLADDRHLIRVFSAVVLAVFVTAYLSAQLTAAGKAFETFLGVPYERGVLVGLAIILLYTVAGGFVAVAWTDFLQGILMVLGLVLLPAAALVRVGGPGGLLAGLGALDPALLSPMGEHGASIKGWLSAAGLAAVGLGFLGSPQLAVRFMALKDAAEIRKGALIAALFTLAVDSGAIFTGMCGRVLLKTLADQEAVLPTLVGLLMPPAAVGVFIAVVLAAIMSTADSLLILASSAVVRDLYQKVRRPDASDESLIGLGRGVTVALCAGALAFALSGTRLVFWFVLFGWAGITAVFCPAIVLSLYWKGLTRAGVLAGMAAGFVITIAWNTVPLDWYAAVVPGLGNWLGAHGFADAATPGKILYEILPAAFGAAAAAVAVSLMTKPPAGAEEDLSRLENDIAVL